MTPVADWIKIDGNRLTSSLQEAAAKLETSQGELVLDFSEVARLDAPAVNLLERMAGIASEKKVRIILRGLNVTAYKVLKLARLSARFTFVN